MGSQRVILRNSKIHKESTLMFSEDDFSKFNTELEIRCGVRGDHEDGKHECLNRQSFVLSLSVGFSPVDSSTCQPWFW